MDKLIEESKQQTGLLALSNESLKKLFWDGPDIPLQLNRKKIESLKAAEKFALDFNRRREFISKLVGDVRLCDETFCDSFSDLVNKLALEDRPNNPPQQLQNFELKPFELKRICGVYFLLIKDTVVYVGKSVYLQSRVMSHAFSSNSGVLFERAYYLECPAEKLDQIEEAFIYLLKPALNRKCNVSSLTLEDISSILRTEE